MLELDDGTFLRESTAICTYLAEGTPLFPDDKLTRARILEWMGFEQTHVDGVISRANFRRTFPDAIPTREEEFDAVHARRRERWIPACAVSCVAGLVHARRGSAGVFAD